MEELAHVLRGTHLLIDGGEVNSAAEDGHVGDLRPQRK